MLAVLSVEIRKLNRSLALLLAAAAPALIAIFAFAMMLRSKQPSEWDMWIGSGLAIWAYFLMPMCVTALTALIAQMEHAPRSWDHLRALPVPRWTLYASKAICVIGLVLVMSAAVLGMTVGAVVLGGMVKPEVAAVGRLDLAGYAWTLIRIAVAAVLMIAIQSGRRFASPVSCPVWCWGSAEPSSPSLRLRPNRASSCPGRCRSTFWRPRRGASRPPWSWAAVWGSSSSRRR